VRGQVIGNKLKKKSKIMASKWNQYDEQITELLRQEKFNNNEIARQILNVEDNVYDVTVLRTYIKRNKNRLLDLNEGIYETAESVAVDYQNVPHYWDKTNKERSVFVKNPNYIADLSVMKPTEEIDFLSIFKDKIEPINIIKTCELKYVGLFDRLVYTDVHVGMNVNPDGYSLYGGVWDKLELNKRLNIMIEKTINHQKSTTLIISCLGDFMDGYNAMTTRGGHDLPQNMDNQEAFDVGLRFKIKLIDALIPYFEKIQCINICNDNHSGSFGYIVNSAFKTYVELKYPNNVEVINQRRFIDHYIIKNRCFILTHGKDDKSLKFGFKPVLDPKQIEKIKNYIDENKLHNYQIEFGKGDSHQYIFDNSTSKHFQYQNFPAFSPPSNWVQTNFQNSISGFVHFNYYENQKSINDYIF